MRLNRPAQVLKSSPVRGKMSISSPRPGRSRLDCFLWSGMKYSNFDMLVLDRKLFLTWMKQLEEYLFGLELSPTFEHTTFLWNIGFYRRLSGQGWEGFWRKSSFGHFFYKNWSFISKRKCSDSDPKNVGRNTSKPWENVEIWLFWGQSLVGFWQKLHFEHFFDKNWSSISKKRIDKIWNLNSSNS